VTSTKPCRVLIPLPSRDFDPSEVAVSWKVLRDAGHEVIFATPQGAVAAADPLMLSGEGLDVWLLLRANGDARRDYRQLTCDASFLRPSSYSALEAEAFDGLILPGGHWARGMREYLEDPRLQRFVAAVFDAGKPVGAICHGVVLAARSISPRSGKSVLFGRKTTALTWTLERSAWSTMKFLGRIWDPNYYRTYVESAGEPEGYRSVQAEVTRALESPDDFRDVPVDAADHLRKASGLFRDSSRDSRPAWVVRDGNYVSARWPGDVHSFAHCFASLLATADCA
jgi:putative intracellular protease/amidase